MTDDNRNTRAEKAPSGRDRLHSENKRLRSALREELSRWSDLSADVVGHLINVAEAAELFEREGTVLTMCDRGPCQQVIEARDRSDPQSRLFNALSALRRELAK